MNSVNLTGRLYKDPSVRYNNSQMCICRFTLIVNRSYKKEGSPTADFISCVAFGKTAEFIEKYFKDKSWIEVSGSIQTGSYEKDGQKVYTTDVLVDKAGFVGAREEREEMPNGFSELDKDEMPF